MRRTSNRELYGIRTVIIMIYTPIREKKISIKPNEFTIYALIIEIAKHKSYNIKKCEPNEFL